MTRDRYPLSWPAAYRAQARQVHPDAGGDHDAMARLNAARDAARRALEGNTGGVRP